MTDDESARGARRGLRWVFWRHLPYGGLVGALILFSISLTPSLLPRPWYLQGVVSGVTALVGFGIGSAISALIRFFGVREPSPQFKRWAWRLLLPASLLIGGVFLYLGAQWDKVVRDLMGSPQQAMLEWGYMVIAALVFGYLFLVISRLFRALGLGIGLLLDLVMPRRIAMISGAGLAVFLFVGFLSGFVFDNMVYLVNGFFSVVNEGTSEGINEPTSTLRSGGPASLISWDSLGVKGRDFTGTGGGPTMTDIIVFNALLRSRPIEDAFTREPATEPIRVYVGLESAGSVEEQVALAVAELDRTEAWDRSVIMIATTTGTGWINEKVAASLEYMHNGDTAIVGLQYSYLPSWISFVLDRKKAASAGRTLVNGVHEWWSQLPEDHRPLLLVYGESLGSYGTESAFDDVKDLLNKVDGALLVGPTFVNPIHNDITENRDEGSPEWRAVYLNGQEVRVAVVPDDLSQPTSPWLSPGIVYLSNSSDPITYSNPALVYSPPDWLGDPRGPDVTPDMMWLPLITFWQMAGDLAFSTGVPAGHGHKYGANVVDGWAALSAPEGWTDADTQRLRDVIGHDE